MRPAYEARCMSYVRGSVLRIENCDSVRCPFACVGAWRIYIYIKVSISPYLSPAASFIAHIPHRLMLSEGANANNNASF